MLPGFLEHGGWYKLLSWAGVALHSVPFAVSYDAYSAVSVVAVRNIAVAVHSYVCCSCSGSVPCDKGCARPSLAKVLQTACSLGPWKEGGGV
mgnify:CR=1 FL=1